MMKHVYGLSAFAAFLIVVLLSVFLIDGGEPLAVPEDRPAVVAAINPEAGNEEAEKPKVVRYFRSVVDPREPEAVRLAPAPRPFPVKPRKATPPRSGERPRVAVIIDDMGPDRVRGREMIALDGKLTLAFLPYAEDVSPMAKLAASKGHELMIHMPMQPVNPRHDIGAIGLKKGMGVDLLDANLDKAFASFEGYAGMNNHMGSLLTQDPVAMAHVMERLGTKGLYFIDSKTIQASVAGAAAAQAGLRTADRDVFLDHIETMDFVRQALRDVEDTARRKGYAIAIGHPKDVTVAGLREWLPTLEAKGIELVPASALVRSYAPANAPKVVPVQKEVPETIEAFAIPR